MRAGLWFAWLVACGTPDDPGAVDPHGSGAPEPPEVPAADDGVDDELWALGGTAVDTAWLGVARWVPPGRFTQGCVTGRDDLIGACMPWEAPTREVVVSRGFLMMQAELTQRQWFDLGATVNPSRNVGDALPVDQFT